MVPPRPNLGPEPLTEPGSAWRWIAILTCLVVLGIGLAVRTWGKWPRTARIPGPIEKPPTRNLAPIVVLAEIARDSLVVRFGASWRAKTTEEIADDNVLAETIGAEDAGRLVALLIEADRVKFSVETASDQGGEVWADWVEAFAAGARSTITGK